MTKLPQTEAMIEHISRTPLTKGHIKAVRRMMNSRFFRWTIEKQTGAKATPESMAQLKQWLDEQERELGKK